ncbi:MAG: SDR family NAD(P)-dependent oxidoreductase [Kiritimatiellae bacterium]|nr:SDR family NAD(P)-dependent oxidoreductase [Kiritimatiellia bacterium]
MVTGVSRGIGGALATELVRRGHTVWGLSRTVPVGAQEGQFRHVVCDVAEGESRDDAAEQMDAAGFVPDAVFLNAAIEYEESHASLEWHPMQAVWRTNVEGALYWVSHWMDGAPRRPVQFIAMSSLFAQWPDPDCPAYAASKAALSMAMRALRLRYSHDPVAFKEVCLGPVHTSINPRFAGGGAAPRGVATPQEVARFLAKTVLPSHRFRYYYPWTVGAVARFGAWMPDWWFERVTRPLRR